jgi:osmotically inducible protein OsmC
MKRTAHARWQGRLRDGQGRLSTASQALSDAKFSFPSRFESGAGTNPEELIAAAHAGCFSMALAFFLEQSGFPPENIESDAELALANESGAWQVAGIRLRVVARVPGLEDARFQEIAARAKAECLVSRLLKTDISLEATLDVSTAAKR